MVLMIFSLVQVVLAGRKEFVRLRNNLIVLGGALNFAHSLTTYGASMTERRNIAIKSFGWQMKKPHFISSRLQVCWAPTWVLHTVGVCYMAEPQLELYLVHFKPLNLTAGDNILRELFLTAWAWKVT